MSNVEGKQAIVLAKAQIITEHKKMELALKDSEEYFRGLFDYAAIPTSIADSDGQFTKVNRAYCELTGYSETELLSMDFLSITHADDRDNELTKFRQTTAGKNDAYTMEKRYTHKSGEIIWVLLTATTISNVEGKQAIFLAQTQNITKRKQAEQALQRSEERYRALYDDNPTMIFTVDQKGIVLSVNQYGADQLGFTVDQLVGNPVVNIFYKDDVQTAWENLHQCFVEPDVVHHWELRKVHEDGTIHWVQETARVITDIKGESNALIVCEDITEKRQLTEQLSFQASHDALTGLVNRREFEHRLQRVLDTTRDELTEHALCYLDLDQFKVINDTCGHVAGDELLHQLGSLLQKEARNRDTLARLGGDEFGVLMEHCSLKQAKRVATKLRKTIEAYRFAWEDRSFAIGVSIGLVPITASSKNTIEILKHVDAACYAAKDAGRNRIHIYSADDAELTHRHGEMQWVAQINRALEEDRFCLYAQSIEPLLPHADDNGEHYELLLRMRDDEGKLIPPGAFLPAAERYNLSIRLDRWVIDHAFCWLTNNPERLQRLSHCTINLSGLSLGNDEFLAYVVQQFEEMIIPPEKICFEITETAAIANLSSATVFIKTLKELGCQFALDDFGSGLSSFAYLKTLPVDYLKIDGMFVKDIETDPIDMAMVKSINDIGKVMGKRTIAEFVENEGILNKLKEINVDYAQGYGISKPRPLESM